MGDPNDPIWNCVTGTCCDAAQSEATLADFLIREVAMPDSSGDAIVTGEAYMKRAASVIMKHFDLAEKDTLKPLVKSIARLARG